MLIQELDRSFVQEFGKIKNPVAIIMSDNFITMLSIELQAEQRFMDTIEQDNEDVYAYRGLPILPTDNSLEIRFIYTNSTIPNTQNQKKTPNIQKRKLRLK